MSSLQDPAIPRTLLTVAEPQTGLAPESKPGNEVLRHFDQSRDSLLRYLYTLGVRGSDGEEVVQEVFLALFQHLNRGRAQSNIRGWLFRVAHNIGLKRLSASRRIETSGDQNIFDNQIDPEPNPEQRFDARQREERLLAVFYALPEVDRGCLSLRAEGLTYREIAALQGISLGSVAKSITRSLDRLQRTDRRL